MKRKRIAYLLWFFLGWCGIHRFYCRKWVSGVLWMLTFGLLGVGWGVDAILTSELVDEANGLPGLPKQGVASKSRKELRNFGLTFVHAPLAKVGLEVDRKKLRNLGLAFVGVVGFLAVHGTASWISEKLDKGTPEQWISEKLDKRTPERKERDAQEQVLREYREIQRGFPSMKLDGKVVSANLQWSADEMIFIVPKTYGFMATRFAQQSASVSRDAFRRNAREYEGHYFVNVPVKEWNGPSEYMSSCLIAVPKSMVPVSFQ
jgi:TM2 domain-containing membrane protein YozV